MIKRAKLSESEVSDWMATRSGWTILDGSLHKQFSFPSFAQAVGWMVTVAVFAESMDHHPHWCNVYNKVTVSLKSFDIDAMSTWDLALAEKMDALARTNRGL